MRWIVPACVAALAFSVSPVHAQNNNFLGQAQRLLGNDNGGDRDAYERGRQDQMQQHQMEREHHRAERERDRDHEYGDRGTYYQDGETYRR